MGFSPFELLYGRAVRGPLDILQEIWQSDCRSNESVLSHVLAMREKLSHMTELVRENLTRAQQQQKRWYDRTAVKREFQTGDQVLVLLPTDTSKLLARWQGPYQILRRIGKVYYLVNMHDKHKKKRVLHVNMLQKWHNSTLTATDYAAEEVQGDGEENDILVWKEDTPDPQPTIGEQLSNKEQGELKELLRRYACTLRSQPGLTPLVEHRICTGTAHPIRLPPYRIPHAYREAVQKEMREMLDTGIIERSRSEWATPIVLVKKEGSLPTPCRESTTSSIDSGGPGTSQPWTLHGATGRCRLQKKTSTRLPLPLPSDCSSSGSCRSGSVELQPPSSE